MPVSPVVGDDDEHALFEVCEFDEAVAAEIIGPAIDGDFYRLVDHRFAQAALAAGWTGHGHAPLDCSAFDAVLRVVRLAARCAHFIERAAYRSELVAAAEPVCSRRDAHERYDRAQQNCADPPMCHRKSPLQLELSAGTRAAQRARTLA